jgi:MFS family permease
MATNTPSAVWYGRFLLFIAGMGGLLYGIDVGIIAAALLYLGKTISLTVEETSFIVAAVLGGSMFSSLVAGVLADWFGRKKMMVVSGVMFVASVGLIVISQAFLPLFLGRLLQGMSGGVIAVVVPLYLAECLSAKTRGQGTAIFQFMLTFGIVWQLWLVCFIPSGPSPPSRLLPAMPSSSKPLRTTHGAGCSYRLFIPA